MNGKRPFNEVEAKIQQEIDEYEVECAAAQSLAQAEEEERWREEQVEEDNRRAAEEYEGPEGEEEL